MAYQIDRYNNTQLTIVEDGTVDQTTDLKFIGKNYAGYGEIQNENFLYLLENFSGGNPPPRALSGQVWYDSTLSKLKFYDGSIWRTTGGSEVSSTEPTGLTEGDFWWDSANDQLYVYNGSEFILIGPQAAGEGLTQVVSTTVLDTNSNPKTVLVGYVSDNPIYVVSQEAFNVLSTETVYSQGFTFIQKGFTVKNTNATGITSAAPNDFYYWGTASNALRLGGSLPSDFVRTTNPVFNSIVTLDASAGLQVGNGGLKIYMDGNSGVIENPQGSGNDIRLNVSDSTGSIVTAVNINETGLVPSQDNAYDIGSNSLKWRKVYAYTFEGEATKTTSLRVGSDFRTASASATNNTVAVRDASGNLTANLFQGTATSARYADLAEKYTTEGDLKPGTVVCVCEHEEHEVEAVMQGCVAIGVVSTDPAIMMNSDADGQYIGLKGRLPVRVVGAVKKGDAVYVDSNGCASTAINGGSLVGIALESNNDEGEKLVECVLKV